ncbi:MAG: protein kinase [Myxococcales bacterium]|nr:protein kinase [Myxococcales bacterium]
MAPIPQLSSVGRYKNLSLLGAGGMGAVYRAYDPSLDRTVALKLVLLQPGHSDHNPDYLIRFEREAKAIARLSHPHIVQVYDFGRDEAGNPYFVMELVKGKALSTVSKERGPLPAAEAVNLIRQAAIGLQAAHDVGIVHRDVKPHNMLVDEKGQVKLVDFGVARVAGGVSEGMTATNEALGTLHYMAPEVLSGKPVDARADIYSLGLVLYHLLTGHPPFQSESAVGVAMKQISEPLPDISNEVPTASAGLRDLLTRMTHKERELRVATCADVAKLAASVLDNLDATAPSDVPLAVAERRARQRRTLLVAAGLGLAAAVAVPLSLSQLGLRKKPRALPKPPPPPPPDAPPPPPQAATAPSPPATGPVRIAVLRFKNLGADPSLNVLVEGIAEQVTTVLGELRGDTPDRIVLLERNQFDEQNLPELLRGKDEYMDSATVARIGRVLGVEVLVQGAFSRIDDQLRIVARFSRVENGEILDSLTLTAPGKSGAQIFAMQDRVASELRDRLVKILPRLRRSPG